MNLAGLPDFDKNTTKNIWYEDPVDICYPTAVTAIMSIKG